MVGQGNQKSLGMFRLDDDVKIVGDIHTADRMDGGAARAIVDEPGRNANNFTTIGIANNDIQIAGVIGFPPGLLPFYGQEDQIAMAALNDGIPAVGESVKNVVSSPDVQFQGCNPGDQRNQGSVLRRSCSAMSGVGDISAVE